MSYSDEQIIWFGGKLIENSRETAEKGTIILMIWQSQML